MLILCRSSETSSLSEEGNQSRPRKDYMKSREIVVYIPWKSDFKGSMGEEGSTESIASGLLSVVKHSSD